MATEQLGGATHRLKASLDWEIDGREYSVADYEEVESFVNRPARRRAAVLKKLKAHVKEHVGPKATVRWLDPEDTMLIDISASGMGRQLFEDGVDDMPSLAFELDGRSVRISFDNIRAGGRRRGKSTRRNKKRRSTRRMA
jgi:hypothetical protein